MPPKVSSTCDHSKLVFSASRNAKEVGYKRPTLLQRIAATTAQGSANGTAITKVSTAEKVEDSPTFPGPLILPGDDLSWDPSYPPQSLRSWVRDKDRNKVTAERRTVYIAAPPEVEPNLEFVQKWIHPQVKSRKGLKAVDRPSTKDVLSYLKAFYHGLPVKMLPPSSLRFTDDVDDDIPDPRRRTIWMKTQAESGCVGIRTRATPKGDFTHQLNLNDLLDAAIDILPDDAYALLLLVEHDIYEDEEDEFACGRAYGGSRIAVVSSARYNPVLDEKEGLEREHAWPASHCERYVERCCDTVDSEEGSRKRTGVGKSLVEGESSKTTTNGEVTTPMQAALSAHASLPSIDQSPSAIALSGLWFGRVCRTASHELGHCFGIDHCVYYACCMQGTGSLREDSRQPLYLCPIDLAKILRATGSDAKGHYGALLAFCEKNMDTHLFAAYRSWICGRVKEIERVD
ncbi:Uncharacterized protein BP5553_03965 [Venustampulla echinocandica]|uniref:Uncharacterized protein n=1 Tax=Venustampulla echinocandica TaxID=2656787 RepID=A0A370TVR5_9HELO|nr:Uncharacterized protein BP5553_03965 [Venustampulla echinocandica]RDL39625.1 Uncharacterized protein BP5553_03965 [Venustampulla echinocandica]